MTRNSVLGLGAALMLTLLVAGCTRLGADSLPSASMDEPLTPPATGLDVMPSVQASIAISPPPGGTLGAEDMQRCNVEGEVEIAFLIPPGDDYRAYLPSMGQAPELENQSGALVVLYAGDATLPLLAGIPDATRDPILHDAVCVLPVTGEPNVYADVSRDGVRIPIDQYIVYVGDRQDSNPCLSWIPRQTPPPECIVDPHP